MKDAYLVSLSLLLLGCSGERAQPRPSSSAPPPMSSTANVGVAPNALQELRLALSKQEAQLKKLEEALNAQINQRLSTFNPKQATQGADAFAALLHQESLSLKALLPADGSLTKGPWEALVEYQDLYAQLLVHSALHQESTSKDEVGLELGLEKIRARIKALGGEEDPLLKEVVGGLAALTQAPYQGFAVELTTGEKARVVLMKEIQKGAGGEVEGYTIYDAKFGEPAPEGAELLSKERAQIAKIDRRNARMFLLDRSTTATEDYFSRLYYLVTIQKKLQEAHQEVLRALDTALKDPSPKRDQPPHKEQLLLLQKTVLGLDAPMEELTTRVLTLQDTLTEADLARSTEIDPSTLMMLNPDALRDPSSMLTRAQTFSLLLQYRFVADLFIKSLLDHTKRSKGAAEDLQRAAQGTLPQPSYVVSLLDQSEEGGIIAGSICISLGEPKKSDGGLTYLLKSSPETKPFEVKLEGGDRPNIVEISNQEVFPKYETLLTQDYQSRIKNLKRLAAQVKTLQGELKTSLAEDTARLP